jgi:hypothetical protein
MYVAFDNLYVTISQCSFIENIGLKDTGGLRVFSGNYYLTLLDCVFDNNTAVSGQPGHAYGGGMSVIKSQ